MVATNDMHDYCKQLLVIGFTHAKHCKDIPTVAVVSKDTCTYNVLYNKTSWARGDIPYCWSEKLYMVLVDGSYLTQIQDNIWKQY